MNIVLCGNPNAGKTTLFNALTRSRQKTGNWHGVTTKPFSKTYKGNTYTDVPGLYSFTPFSMEEVSSAEAVKEADVLVQVIDATTLSTALTLTRRLVLLQKPFIVYLTKLNLLKRRGGTVDMTALSKALSCPVVSDVKQLKKAISGHIPPPQRIFTIPKSAYTSGNAELRPIEKIFYHPVSATALFCLFMVLLFCFAFHPSCVGMMGKRMMEEGLQILSSKLLPHLQNQAVRSLVSEAVFGGVGSVLTFLPQLTLVYGFLILIDQSGVLSALSFATDGLFRKCNLSGRSAFSLLSGFGCTTTAVATTGSLVSKSTQRQTVAMLSFIPCGARLPVFLTFLSPLFSDPFPVVCALYFSALFFSLLVGKLMARGGEEMLCEVVPIGSLPIKQCVIDLFFMLKSFIIKVTTTVFVFSVLSWAFSHFSFSLRFVAPNESMLAEICRFLSPVFYPMGGDWRIVYALLSGLFAKENIVATLALLFPTGFAPTLAQGLSLCVFTLVCPACVSALSATANECGKRFTLRLFLCQCAVAFALSYLVYFIFELIL